MSEPDNLKDHKLVHQPTSTVISFGKHRGERIEDVMLTDRKYVDWLMAQPWFREKNPTLVTIIVNGGMPADADTPEHNRMQALFLDGEFCLAAVRSIVGDDEIERRLRKWLPQDRCVTEASAAASAAERNWLVDWRLDLLRAEIAKGSVMLPKRYLEDFEKFDTYRSVGLWGGPWPDGLPQSEMEDRVASAGQNAAEAKIEEIVASGESFNQMVERGAVMEHFGWDVFLAEGGVYVELKPSLGDDYPSVLRTMKQRACRTHGYSEDHSGLRALIIDRFDADGATYDQVVRIFNASAIAVRTLSEIKALVRTEQSS